MTWIEEWKYYTQNQSFHRQKTKSNQDWQKSGFAWSSGLQNENTNWYVVCTNFMLFSSSKCFFPFPLNWFRAIFVPFKGQRFRPFWFLLRCSAWDFSFHSVQNAITTHLYYELKILYPPLCNEKHTAACITYLLFSVIRTITRGAFLNYLDPSRQFSTEFSMNSSSSIKTMGNH